MLIDNNKQPIPSFQPYSTGHIIGTVASKQLDPHNQPIPSNCGHVTTNSAQRIPLFSTSVENNQSEWWDMRFWCPLAIDLPESDR